MTEESYFGRERRVGYFGFFREVFSYIFTGNREAYDRIQHGRKYSPQDHSDTLSSVRLTRIPRARLTPIRRIRLTRIRRVK